MSVPHDRVGSVNSRSVGYGLSGLDYLALTLMVIGGLNWGLVGAFDMDLVARLFGQMTTVSRAIYILVGLAALYGIVLMMKLARRD